MGVNCGPYPSSVCTVVRKYIYIHIGPMLRCNISIRGEGVNNVEDWLP